MRKSRLFFAFFCWIFVTTAAQATHIRAGEILAERKGTSRTFIFRFVGYRDTTPGTVEFGDGLVNFGDGSVAIKLNTLDPSPEIMSVGNETERWVFEFEHTFPANGVYTISFREFNRNEGILNIGFGNSVNTPFYIETQILIFTEIGGNKTPTLLVPPIDIGCTNVAFIHNPGAFDVDGDSIAYRLVVPLQDEGLEVNQYRFPANQELYNGVPYDTEDGDTPAIFSLDPITGDMVWNAPGIPGEYNMAFHIEEWRKISGDWVRISYVTRDMQVLIEECDNERPELIVPQDTCVEAGTFFETIIQGTDPDGDQVKMEAFGGPFEVTTSPATFGPTSFQPIIAQSTFAWQTNCTHVREKPYTVQFKISDKPPFGPSLVDFATWNIRVVGPPPVVTSAQVKPGRSIQLDWEPYVCAGQADIMQIWRRVGSYDFTPEGCEVGMPEYAGYELIKQVDISVTSFTDIGLDVGANYCYRLVASFQGVQGGVSYASNEECALILADAPVITHVDIQETSESEGEIIVSWRSPFSIDEANFPPPFRYEVFRANGFTGESNYTLVQSTSDTTITDTGLNTMDQIYNYRIHLYDASNTLVDSSASASSVRLDPQSNVNAVLLQWNAVVPWSNNTQKFPYHYIYRNNVLPAFPDSLVLIDSTNVNFEGFVYWDDGSFNGQELSDQIEYCYEVVTSGAYDNPDIDAPLLNRSQRSCALPNDTIPPCPPLSLGFGNLELQTCEEFLADKPCDFNDFENLVLWDDDGGSECRDDIRSYNVYYSRTGEDGTYVLITNTTDNFYLHSRASQFPLVTYAGCYRVAAVDRSGNESEFSETLCRDNCPFIEFPNVFTPNGDGANDTFRPYYYATGQSFADYAKCPRFVEYVVLTVVDRWGVDVFVYDSRDPEHNILINWNGQTNNGSLVAPGVYYYSAEVKFIMLDPDSPVQNYKGWVQVLY